MGYVRNKRYRLQFKDDEFEGLEVVAKPLPIGQHLELLGLLEDKPNPSGAVEWVGKIHSIFADALVSWNLETEAGKPIPANLEGLSAQDYEFSLEIIRAYMSAITGVSAPLEQQSPDGAPPLVESLPMEPL